MIISEKHEPYSEQCKLKSKKGTNSSEHAH